MSNEITVRIKCSLDEMYNILENKGFNIVDKYNLEDIYYIKKDCNVKKQLISKLLERYILIRKITQFVPSEFKDSYNINLLVLKNKDIALDGTIKNQQKKECEIQSIEQGKEFIEALRYKQLIVIREKTLVYGKGELKLAIKDIENGENLIEIETVENFPELDSIEKIKQKIKGLQIPIDTNDYFVKKAEIELKKIL